MKLNSEPRTLNPCRLHPSSFILHPSAPSPEPRVPSPARRRRRSGVVLLIVVSLLALFVLLGVTYSLSVSQYHRGSKLNLLHEASGDPPHIEADLVLGQVLYDTNARTVLQYHSLLRDLYGHDANIISNTTAVTGCYPQYRETFQGTVADITTVPNGYSAGNQLFTFTFALPLPNPIPPQPPYLTALSPIPNYYAGRVITFQSGNCANHSARIVAYTPAPPPGTRNVPDLITPNPAIGQLTIEMIESKLAGSIAPTVGSTFVVNGGPFNGSGTGYNATTYGIDSTYTAPGGTLPGYPIALLPNVGAYDAAGTYPPNDYGGVDESWDAVDLQNMYLAMVPPRAAEAFFSGAPVPIIPSFHRPELVNFWLGNLPSTDPRYPLNPTLPAAQLPQPQRDFLRTFIFRPMPWDHPNFTGSNPYFSSSFTVDQLIANLINANNLPMWDVDNDNDGVPDSIWIDPGLPVVTTPEGRRYKRLAAILIKDLDGSINLNAHGNLAQVPAAVGGTGDIRYRAELPPQPGMLPAPGMNSPNYTPPPSPVAGMVSVLGLAPNLVPYNTNNNTTWSVPRGMGFGPAEVDFLKIFTNTTPAYNDAVAMQAYANLLRVRYQSNVGGDSGAAAVPGYPYVPNFNVAFDYRDPLAAIKHYGIPNDYANLNAAGIGFPQWYAQPSWYASPPDVWGKSIVTLDPGGQPLFAYAGQQPIANVSLGEVVDSPYEMALGSETNNSDSPYTPAELERLLRYHDPDATQLPPRILNAANTPGGNPLAPGYPAFTAAGSEPPGVIGQSHRRRNMLTTLSSDIPVPATQIPQEFRQDLATSFQATANGYSKLPGSTSILDLYYARLLAGGVPAAQISTEMQKIVPWEFFKGQKFDINRSVGDGVDQDNDGVRDEPTENAAGELAWPAGPASPGMLPNMPATFQSNTTNPIYFQHTNGFSNGPNNSFYARQLYARHLFCLAMLFLPQNLQPNFSYDSAINGNTTQGHQVVVRRIAQWAINCVDFRDQDSIMTPFEFDYNPWNGWNVDGDLSANSSDNGHPDRGLVWGIEAPELLITETLAFHDRGLKDTDKDDDTRKKMTDPNPGMRDDDPDQFRVPQGSLFLELYCPKPKYWNGEANNTKPYSGAVNLSQLAPQHPNTGHPNSGLRRPVWRIALSQLTNGNIDQNTPAKLAVQNPETCSFDPIVATGTGWAANTTLATSGGSSPLPVDRFVYFANINNGVSVLPSAEASASFYNTSGGNPSTTQFLLNPGQYAVVGPRALTYLGSQDPTLTSNPPSTGSTNLWGGNSNQYIQILPSNVVAHDTSSAAPPAGLTTRTPNFDMQFPVGLVCEMPFPAGTGWAWNQGLNVSEPLATSTNYYPGGNTRTTYYPGQNGNGTQVQPNVIDPRSSYANFYDDPDNATPSGFPDAPIEESSPTGKPISPTMLRTGSYLDSCTAFLQRLADPSMPYNPLPSDAEHDPNLMFNGIVLINPYVTVDWASIDLTVFTGEEDATNSGISTATVYDDRSVPLYFRSRQRGYLSQGTTPLDGTMLSSNPWPPLTQNGTNISWQTPLQGGSATYFNINLSNNRTNAAAAPTYPYTYNVTDRHTLGSLNSTVDFPITNGVPQPTIYLGEPIYPFPWISWNNRPFMNAMELLTVPASSPTRFYLEMTPGLPPTNLSTQPTSPRTPYANNATNIGAMHLPFGQMLNFFQTTTCTPDNLTANGQAPHLYRLLDYVEVPSPYAGAERWYNPNNFGGLSGGTFNSGAAPFGIFYRPPFNKLSRFRDPGRVNVNTIFDTDFGGSDVWDSVVGQFPGLRYADGFTKQLFLSRQGHGNANSIYVMQTSHPTRFANPVRSADSADLMSIAPIGTPPGPTNMRKTEPVSATLLRRDPANISEVQPLFRLNVVSNTQYRNWAGTPETALDTSFIGQYHDTIRNPYFAYQPYQKIGSVLTTRSNCFAVWITIGYFEVEEYRPGGSGTTVVIDAAHPEGLSLGQEVGADSGEISRHRAFYIIDRSIPVGFIPGSRLNTDECVLVRRLIE